MKHLVLVLFVAALCLMPIGSAADHEEHGHNPQLTTYRIEVGIAVTQLPDGFALPAVAWIDVETSDAQKASEAFARALGRGLRHEVHVVGTGAQTYGP